MIYRDFKEFKNALAEWDEAYKVFGQEVNIWAQRLPKERGSGNGISGWETALGIGALVIGGVVGGLGGALACLVAVSILVAIIRKITDAIGESRKQCLEKTRPRFLLQRPVYRPTKQTGGPHEFSLEEVELMNMCPDDGRVPHVPFGFQNSNWLKFKSKVQPGDKIVEFSSGAESWQLLCGRAGYQLVRGSEIVDTLVTSMN